MRLVTFRSGLDRRLGLVLDGRIADLRHGLDLMLAVRGIADREALVRSLVPAEMADFIAMGEIGLAAAREVEAFLNGNEASEWLSDLFSDFADVELEAPVTRPSKIFCVVSNNRELVGNAQSVPDHPIYFSKPANALLGHGCVLRLPKIGIIHPEAELGVVIGRKARNVAAANAYDFVFGYTIFNDVTSVRFRHDDAARNRISMTDPVSGEPTFEDLSMTPMARHKGIDGFAPSGPWIVTRDEVDDPHALSVEARLGEKIVNRDHTGTLRFHVPQVIEHISAWHTLLPGDIITMGTASSTSEWPMREADMNRLGGPVAITIEKIGTLENPVQPNAWHG